jgi:hypothetical protein
VQELITRVAEEVADQIAEAQVGTQVDAAEKAAARAETAASNAESAATTVVANALSNYSTTAEMHDYVATEIANADIDNKLTAYAKKDEVNDLIGDIGESQNVIDYVDTAIKGVDVTEQLKDYALKSEIPTVPEKVSAFENDAGYLTEHQSLEDYALKTDIPSVEGLATETYVQEEIAKVDVSNQLADYAKSADVETKIANVQGQVDANKKDISTLSSKVSTNETNIGNLTSNAMILGTKIADLEEAVKEIGDNPGYEYEASYGKTILGATGEETDNVFTLYQLNGDERTVKSQFVITGGSGGGSISATTLTVERITPSPFVITTSDKAIVEFNCTSYDDDGQTVDCSYSLKKGSSVIMSGALAHGLNSFDLTKYINTGTHKFTLTVTDEGGSMSVKGFTVQMVDIRLELKFDDQFTTSIDRPVSLTYIPHGAVNKTVHFKLDGVENTINTSASGVGQPYVIEPQSHGAHLLEAWITATVNNADIETDHIYKDIIWYDEESPDAVIGCIYRNDFYGQVTARQYDTTTIIYNVFDPTTNYPTIKRYVDDDLIGTDTPSEPQTLYRWDFQTDKVGTHTLKIVVRDTEVTIVVKVEELGIDVAPVIDNLEIDFNPTGRRNSSADRIWFNDKYTMSVSDNFDWSSGGYQEDENGDTYFLVKAGTRASFNYLMFKGGLNENPSILGSEMKLIFMTENVQDKDAVWFSNVETTTTKVDGVTQTTNVGIQLGVHEGWLKTNNASDTDVEGDDASGAVAATNTYLYMPYSEEDIIEMDINIDTLDRTSDTAKSFVMAYEDGVPSKAYVYDNSDRFYQYTPQPIVIGSDYCDVRIYRMKIYSASLSTENIMRNFIADSRNSTTMLARYDRNSIYFNRETNTYTPYSGQGVIDPEKLAPIVPNAKILMLETDHFTTSKKTFVKSNFRCIHAPGGDIFAGDAFYDNWLFENGWHSGQGTTSDNYGNSSRNVDFLFNCDGVHKPSDKVDAESGYISQVTMGYGTENARTEQVTDWKGDAGKVALTRTSVPNNFFNMKVNVASSENVNNMLLQKRYNDFLPYISPAKKRNPNVKCVMEFVPAILFIRETNPDISTHNEFLDTEWHFYSLGNIGDSKKTDYTRAYDPEDMNEFTLEISDNTKNNATFQSGVYIDGDGNRQIERFTITESEDDGDIILTPVSVDKPQSFVYPITTEEWEDENNMRHWCIYNEGFDGDHSFEARYACCGDYRDGKLVNDTSGRGKAQMKLNEEVWRAFYRWVITATDEEFVKELDEWCVRSAVEFFYAFTHIYTMMDNRAKNTFWHFAKTGTYRKVSKPVPELLHVYCELVDGEYVTTTDEAVDSSKTYYTQYAFDMHDYDNDTALGINNNGELVFPYGKEDKDYNIDDSPSSGYVFNGATSVFWCRLRDLLAGEIKATFQNVAAECFSDTHLINQFDAYQECFPEEIWRLDIQRKYIRTFTGGSIDNSKPKHDVQYLRDMMQGRKKYQRRQWVRDQVMYFGTMNLMNTVVGDDNRITFRCFTPTGTDVVVKPNYTLKITPYSDMYLSVMFGNGGVQQVRAKSGKEYTIDSPLASMDDTQVTIYGANRIQALNDLSTCYIAANNFSMASKLRKLVIGNKTPGYNNTRLVSLTLGDNKLLEELDIRNCGNLTGSINLANSNNLLKLYAEGTKLTGVTFATNGKLQVAHLPSTINALTMRNLNNLVDFQATLSQLETLTLQGGTLDSLDIVTRCINTLQVLSLYDIDWQMDNVDLLEKIAELFSSLLTGKAHISLIGSNDLNSYRQKWPDLTITATTVKPQFKVTFLNDNGEELDVQYVEMYKDAVDPTSREDSPIAIPTKDSTAQYEYTYAGWDKSLTNITSDRIIKATYAETVRKYTVQYVSRGEPILTKYNCLYGDIVTYDAETLPTYTGEEPYTFYLFDGWDKSGYVNGNKTINALFDSCVYDDQYFEGKDLSTLRPVELYMMMKLSTAGVLSIADYVGPKDTITIHMGNDVNYADIEDKVLIEDMTVFNGTNYVDTGIKLFSEDRSFVLAIDYKMNTNANGSVLAQCFSGLDTSGFKLAYNNGVKLAWGGASMTPSEVNGREMLVIRHIKGENGLHVYTSNIHGNNATYINLEGVHAMVHNVSLVFGCNKLEDGSYEQHARGIVYWSKLWYADLGDDICTQLVCWPHEEMSFEVCCEANGDLKRYYLSDNSGSRSSMVFIASGLLPHTMMMHTSTLNMGGWAEYALNTYLNNRVYGAFPIVLKQLMKQVKVKSTVGNKSSEISNSDCYVFIPSVAELDSSMNIDPYVSEGTLISHFSNNDARVCRNANGEAVQYWTRSPNIQYDSYMHRISDTGSVQTITTMMTSLYTRIMIAM